MPTNKIPFHLHLDEALLKKIKLIAKRETRSASNLMEHLCKLCVIEYEQKNGEIVIDDD